MPRRGTWVRTLRLTGWSAGWSFDKPHPRKFLFARSDLTEVPTRLRDPATQQRLLRTVEPFAKWVLETHGEEAVKVFQLVCDAGGWNFPWELIIDEMAEPADAWRIAFARRLKRAREIAPSRLDHPLRLLILRGDARLGLLRPLDLGREIATLHSVWEGLPASVRGSVQRPVQTDADLATLSSVVAADPPDIVWFVGHGRRKRPGLLFHNGQWVSPELFFQQFPRNRPPLFVVLMACDTASGDDPEPLEQPAFARTAFEAGVAVLLAMQAPIGDVSSRILARELFSELAVGSSPAVALARARMVLRQQGMRGPNAVDWAAPVVWSAIDDSKRWQWNHQPADRARHQLFGREIMQSALVHPETAAAAPTEEELETARVWLARRRTWVQWTTAEKESVAVANRVLAAVQHVVEDVVLVFDLQGGAPETELPEWAERAGAYIRPGVHPDELVDFVEGLRNPAAGWNHVARLSNATIGILGAPEYDEQHWFWAPFRNTGTGPRVIVFSARPFAGAPDGDWALENLLLAETAGAALAAMQSAPRLARALAVLEEPLRESAMELAEPDPDGASRVADWADAGKVLIEIAGGLLMADSAAAAIREQSTEDQMRDAHLDCYAMLYAIAIRSTPLLEEMAEHLRLGGATAAYAQAASHLTTRYRYENRPHAAARVSDALGLNDFAPRYYLYAAWALTALGRTEESEFLLARTDPDTPLAQAWKHGLSAENAKAAGDRDGAVREIEDAIAVCAEGLRGREDADLRRAWRNYRQDRARILQYLFYETGQARDLYLELLREWQREAEAEIAVAVVRRNLAECFSTLAAGVHDPLFRKARDELKDARAVAERYPGHPLIADVLYEESKLAERASQQALADQKLDASLHAAREAGYHQMVAIVTARIFWRREPFTLARWSDVAEMLELYGQHGWPVRTLVDGRLRAAKILADQGDDAAALDQLLRTEETLRKHPAFVRGSDRERRARTAAGIDVLSRRLGSPRSSWTELQKHDWAREYLASINAREPEEVWARGGGRDG